ncbi:hypothetical protein SUGI_0230600 [Cryptomeria japonica]|nr:hypothetical protein SUGI_0230600 [Cryptomeria japonica]
MERQEDENTHGETVQATTFHLLFRALPLPLCIAAMVIMLHNSQTNDYGALHYSNVAAFKYLIYTNGICAGYSLLSAIDSALFAGLQSLTRAWIIFILDQVLTYVTLTSVATGVEILFLSYEGDHKVTWSRVCVSFDKFCYKARTSIFLSSVVLVCFVVSSIISAYKLFTNYEPPLTIEDHQNQSEG